MAFNIKNNKKKGISRKPNEKKIPKSNIDYGILYS
jgi:hypothetical protein